MICPFLEIKDEEFSFTDWNDECEEIDDAEETSRSNL